MALLCAPIGASASANHRRGRSDGHIAVGLDVLALSAQNCRSATFDSEGKEMARVAETTAETIATDNEGSYTHVTLATLRAYEPLIAITPKEAQGGAYMIAASGTTDSYSVTARAPDGNTFTIKRGSRGSIVRTARVCGHTQSW